MFKTVKYDLTCPEVFDDIDHARQWTADMLGRYAREHRHSGIKFVTPTQRHYGQEHVILERRRRVYEAAKQSMPERWKGRHTRDWNPVGEVWLNPPKESAADDHKLSRAA